MQEIFEVQQRLAHAHEDHVGDPLFGQPLEHQILSNDFPRSEVSVESAQTSRAERTSHRASNLAAETTGDSTFVGQKDALIHLMIAVVNEELVNSVGRCFVSGNLKGLDLEVLIEVCPEISREVEHGVERVNRPLIEMSGNLF